MRRLAAAALLLLSCGFTWPSVAYESDQYSHRLVPIADSAELLDDVVNRVITEVAAEWNGPRSDWKFALALYWRLGGLHWVDKIERFAMESPEVERLPLTNRRGIFTGSPCWATRVNCIFGVGRTIRLAGVLVGTDKLGHFFSQGLKYYESAVRGQTLERVVARGEFNELWIFGELTTAIYSNADLVANYEGYLFYRSLFQEGALPGKGPILAWREGRPVVLRPFSWADHVNDYWDEALNPSHLGWGLQRFMTRRLPELCAEVRGHPDAFIPRSASELEHRYANIGLKPAPQNRLDRVCGLVDSGEEVVDGHAHSRPPGR